MFFSLSLVKTSQRSLVQSLAMTYPGITHSSILDKAISLTITDIHFALLNVEGQVSPESKDFSPTRIAREFWELYSQEKNNWTLDRDVLSSS